MYQKLKWQSPRESLRYWRLNWLSPRESLGHFFFLLFNFFHRHFLLSSSTHRSYPQRSSGQADVTGVVPFPPRYVPSFLSRIGFNIPTARRFSSNVANSRSRDFRLSILLQEKVPTSICTGERWSREIIFCRREDSLPSHRGRGHLKNVKWLVLGGTGTLHTFEFKPFSVRRGSYRSILLATVYQELLQKNNCGKKKGGEKSYRVI